MSGLVGRFMGRDPIGYWGSKWGLHHFLKGRVLTKLDPTGLVPIACTCEGYSPRDAGGGLYNYTRVVNCLGVAQNCCANACNPGDRFTGDWKIVTAIPDDTGAEKELIDAVTDIFCVSLLVFDVATFPSGEGPAGCLAAKSASKVVKKCFSKKAKEVATCEFIYDTYSAAQFSAGGCTAATDCATAAAKASAKATEVAMRQNYLGKRCDYILPGSIAVGSAIKEAGHRQELLNAINRLARCSAHASSVCQKECCGK
jgi:hypothetical protein